MTPWVWSPPLSKQSVVAHTCSPRKAHLKSKIASALQWVADQPDIRPHLKTNKQKQSSANRNPDQSRPIHGEGLVYCLFLSVFPPSTDSEKLTQVSPAELARSPGHCVWFCKHYHPVPVNATSKLQCAHADCRHTSRGPYSHVYSSALCSLTVRFLFAM